MRKHLLIGGALVSTAFGTAMYLARRLVATSSEIPMEEALAVETAEQVEERLNQEQPPTNPSSWLCKAGIHWPRMMPVPQDTEVTHFVGTWRRCSRCGIIEPETSTRRVNACV